MFLNFANVIYVFQKSRRERAAAAGQTVFPGFGSPNGNNSSKGFLAPPPADLSQQQQPILFTSSTSLTNIYSSRLRI